MDKMNIINKLDAIIGKLRGIKEDKQPVNALPVDNLEIITKNMKRLHKDISIEKQQIIADIYRLEGQQDLLEKLDPKLDNSVFYSIHHWNALEILRLIDKLLAVGRD